MPLYWRLFAINTAVRTEPIGEHMNTEHIEVAADASDVHAAETFLHTVFWSCQ
jgi:hypothetical protein